MKTLNEIDLGTAAIAAGIAAVAAKILYNKHKKQKLLKKYGINDQKRNTEVDIGMSDISSEVQEVLLQKERGR